MMKLIIFDWVGVLYKRNEGLFPFTREILEKLKDEYKFALVTRSHNVSARKKEINKSGLSHYFKMIKVLDIDNREEKGQAFSEIINKLGIEPKDTIIVDDRMSRGIKPANDLGCVTVWIQKGDRSFDAPSEKLGEPNYKLDNVNELKEIIK